ncbi:Protein unc-13-like protein C [Frankliniella fusca]|uniref:Protein unc-13-like protein C n=1 Tax=Frankliniella fusca TaxID=407009 RepID=A0AAE1HA07_9NEOP|nr:Protein unc-13-like protein C [Frankliniella fusca]
MSRLRSGNDNKADNKQTVGEMSKSELISLIGDCLKPVNETVQSLKNEVSKLTNDVARLTSEIVSKDAVIAEMKSRLEECEQYARRNCLRIFGLPEKPNEKTDELVVDLAVKLGINISETQIDRSHRVGKPGTKPRPIIVKFIGYATRKAVFTSKKTLKGSGITIRKDLTRQRLDLLKKTAEVFTEKNVWTQDGVILVKVPGVQRPVRLRSVKDLDSAKLKYVG